MFNINPYKNKKPVSSTGNGASKEKEKTLTKEKEKSSSSSSSSSSTSKKSSSSSSSKHKHQMEEIKMSPQTPNSGRVSSHDAGSLSLTSMSEITNSLSNTHTATDTSNNTNDEVSEIGDDYDPFLSILEEPIEGEGGIEKETTEELQEMLAVLKGVQNECNVLLLGRTGVGKSSTLNTVFGIDIPVHSSESCTQEPFTYSRNVNGFKLNIIDTPGFLDSQGDEVDSANMLKIQRYLSGKTIHCVLFVEKFTETRFDGAHQLVINQFTEKLGPQLWRNAAVVLTYANSPLPDSCYDGFDEEDEIGPWRKHLDDRSIQFKKFFTHILQSLPQDDGYTPKNISVYAMENSRRCRRNEQGQRILIDGTPCLHLLISGLLRMVDPKTAFLFMGHLRAKNKPSKSHRGDQQDRERGVFDNLAEILKLFVVPPFDQLGKGTVAKILESWGRKLDRYGNLPNLLKI
ncbi:GTP-binding protein [Cavenderia fasciculata]|uniref:GTP-binding protein n=1 Tax=Cavenderia fasciculata TaxID=261658 RepID=F4PJN6_CACFS|nr:GTP-binding protein [Cavenderia fasciculata]EGG23810.1 GTP-binding protein [Cavenderia fasciculata]|eukprot:XP_004361661.1 GTP-binding protein [Cavenderia fasciculata]